MDDNRLPDILSLTVQLLNKKQRSQRLAVIPGQHFFIQHGLIKEGQLSVDPPLVKLLKHKPIHLAFISQIQLGKFLPVLLYVSI